MTRCHCKSPNLYHRGHRGTQGNTEKFLSFLFLWLGRRLGGLRLWSFLRPCSRNLRQLRGHGSLHGEESAIVCQHFGSAAKQGFVGALVRRGPVLGSVAAGQRDSHLSTNPDLTTLPSSAGPVTGH